MPKIGTYIDKDKNRHLAIEIGPDFVVKSPGKDDDGADRPKVRVSTGKVRCFTADEYGVFAVEALAPESISWDGAVAAPVAPAAPIAPPVDPLA